MAGIEAESAGRDERRERACVHQGMHLRYIVNAKKIGQVHRGPLQVTL
jgi:hypothetical protein